MEKFNMGCGSNIIPEWNNIDILDEPSGWYQIWDLEHTPWPWATHCASEILFNHSLEHMGQDPKVFLAIMKEIYRIAEPGCLLKITVPHPRHDDFLGDPTHVRIITPQLMSLFSKANCAEWKKMGAANTRFAEILDVDFEAGTCQYVLDQIYLHNLNTLNLSSKERAKMIDFHATHSWNVVKEIKMELRIIK